MGFGGIERRIEEVGAELPERGMDPLSPGLEELDDRRIEADRDRARHLEDEPRAGRRPLPGFTRPVPVPRPVHPQVRAELQAAVEPDDEVLADRVDGIDRASDEAVRLRDGTWTVGARRGDGPPDEVRPQTRGGPEQRVAFRHSDRRWVDRRSQSPERPHAAERPTRSSMTSVPG